MGNVDLIGFRISALLLLVGLLVSACTPLPPSSQRVTHDPFLSRSGGVVLFADVCVQFDTTGDDDDYFVVSESKAGARALLATARQQLIETQIRVKAEIVPFVCGSIHDANEVSLRVADRRGGTVRNQRPPFAVQEDLRDELEYVDALSRVSSYAFGQTIHAAAPNNQNDGETSTESGARYVTGQEYREAIGVVANKTQASSILYFGVAGTKLSPGKATAQFIGSMLVGMGTAFATAGAGTGYYLIFVPGRQMSGRLMTAALIDLEDGRILWSDAVRAGGDPLKPEVVGDAESMNLLLRSLLFQPVS